MKVYNDIEQGTPEWFELRLRKVTASRFADILAKGQGKQRAKYRRQVIAESLTGKPVDQGAYGSWAANLDRGHEQEPLARWSYELLTGYSVQKVSFIQHDTLRAGCSPDGLIVGKPRGAEIKSVISTVQVDTIESGSYPSEHKAQIQGSMWITGFPEWDFCSYSPDMPKHLRTYIYTVPRDEAYIAELEREVLRFLADVDQALSRLRPGGTDLEGLLRQSLKEAA